MKSAVILAFMLIGFSGFAQEITLGLTLRDAHSGDAAENVEVYVMGPKGYEETISSDQDGNIELADLASGVYFVQIENEEYSRYSKGFPVRRTENRQIFLTPTDTEVSPPTLASFEAEGDSIG